MSILDTKDYKKLGFCYLLGTVFTIIFSIIYECFSHNVFSNYMIFAFAFPLIGLILSIFLSRFKLKVITINLLNIVIISLTFYSLIKGVLDIYGTTNSLSNIYIYLGIAALISAFLSIMVKTKNS